MNQLLFALFLAPTNPLAKTVSVYLYKVFHKDPFRGIYQPNAFDLSILIPYFKIACELTNFESYLVTFAFYISYFFMSLPSSYLLKKTGFKKGMMIGLLVMAVGALNLTARCLFVALQMLFAMGAGEFEVAHRLMPVRNNIHAAGRVKQ